MLLYLCYILFRHIIYIYISCIKIWLHDGNLIVSWVNPINDEIFRSRLWCLVGLLGTRLRVYPSGAVFFVFPIGAIGKAPGVGWSTWGWMENLKKISTWQSPPKSPQIKPAGQKYHSTILEGILNWELGLKGVVWEGPTSIGGFWVMSLDMFVPWRNHWETINRL